MNQKSNPQFDRTELEASLARLGIRELEERMEISPLLTGGGTEEVGQSICCTCKIPDLLGPDGTLPYPNMDPGPGLR